MNSFIPKKSNRRKFFSTAGKSSLGLLLISSFPMKKIDVEILIQFRDKSTASLRLNSLDSATLKLEFQRK